MVAGQDGSGFLDCMDSNSDQCVPLGLEILGMPSAYSTTWYRVEGTHNRQSQPSLRPYAQYVPRPSQFHFLKRETPFPMNLTRRL